MPDIGLILLAAGQSSRLGQPKQLLDFGGKPLLRHAAETALASVCRPIVVVLGAYAPQIEPTLAGLAVEVAINPQWEKGVGTSIRAGLAALAQRDLQGVVLCLADQPLVTASIYDRLVTTFRAGGAEIVTSEYSGTVGVPVLFGRSLFGQLTELAPDQGCKGVILRNASQAVRIPCPEAETDIDSPADWSRLRAG